MQRLIFIVYAVIIATILSCNRSAEEDRKPFVPVFSTLEAESVSTDSSAGKKEIFYGVLTPLEISGIFTRLNAPYTPEILNDPANSDHYLSSSGAAINLGIYGADLGYLKMFGLNNEMGDYIRAIRTLSSRLGIPMEYFTRPMEEMEKEMTDADTVFQFVNDSYKKVEDHLRQDSRESTAGLIVLGGWIEALYISTQMLFDYTDPDPEVVERIAGQKYTLNALLSFLKNYYDDPVVVYYTKKLKHLKKFFDRFDIYFMEGDLEIDSERQVLKSSGSEMTITVKTLGDIRDYVFQMRTEATGV
jgi:hypothetical protein